jgi:hypothetical protein
MFIDVCILHVHTFTYHRNASRKLQPSGNEHTFTSTHMYLNTHLRTTGTPQGSCNRQETSLPSDSLPSNTCSRRSSPGSTCSAACSHQATCDEYSRPSIEGTAGPRRSTRGPHMAHSSCLSAIDFRTGSGDHPARGRHSCSRTLRLNSATRLLKGLTGTVSKSDGPATRRRSARHRCAELLA